MSLLMDALRKAEQQKRQGADNSSAPASQGAPETAETLKIEPLPELPQRMEDLDDQFLASDPALQKSIRALAASREREAESPSPPLPAGSAAARAAAQNVFAAKSPAATIRPGFATAVGVFTLLAIAAIGGYFYWQLPLKGGFAAAPGLTANLAPQPVAPAPAPAPARVAMAPAEAPAPVPRQAPQPTPAGKAAGAGAYAGSTQAPDTAIRVGARPPQPDTAMETAHAAFTRGEIELARVLWLKALEADPRNINALHGLAALALREGRPEQAAPLYRRALEVNPRDALAHAGLLSLAAPADIRLAESRLRGLLAEQPDAAPLHFALGNLYMGEARWAEAQQSFFQAHVADPTNPDYVYNLAVSLDHLRQTSLAAQYYARALAAESQAVAFDRSQAEIRLRQLQAAHLE